MSLDNFEKQKNLGQGAFGSVWLVKRKADKKLYAMKRINIANSSEEEKDAALNEIRLLASLHHINIIGYKEAFYDSPSNTLNIVMEYANGGDLYKRIEINKQLHCLFREDFIWEWIFQLLYGVVYLHSHKIIHRDLKTANIFLMKNGILKIGDLNVSKLAQKGYARTQTGTPLYLAPEVWDDLKYDDKCDVWSLGCIFYELCTLSPPFYGQNYRELRTNVKKGQYNPIPNDYSDDLKQIIDWMLVVNPNNRKSSKELLYSDIIKRKLKSLPRKDIIRKIVKAFYSFVPKSSIKWTERKTKINDVLPKENYKMYQNDPFESMKKSIRIKESQKIQDNNNNIPQNYQPKIKKEISKKIQNEQNNINNINRINTQKNQNNINNNFIRENKGIIQQFKNDIISNRKKKDKSPFNPKNKNKVRPPSGQPKNNNNRFRIFSPNNINMNNNLIKNQNIINHQKKNNFVNKKEQIRHFKIKDSIVKFDDEIYDMRPYKIENKAKYNILDIDQYKMNNLERFNNYLNKGGRNNVKFTNQINVKTERVNSAMKKKK